MKQRLFSLWLLLSVAVGLSAYDFKVDGLCYNITSSSDKTVEVTYQEEWYSSNYEGLTSVTIPASVTYEGTTYSVTSIGSSAFNYCTSLTSITIPNSVTSIGSSAFSYCTGLTSITIPNSVTSIGSSAFIGCTSLTSITIPNSVTSIGSSAFESCIGLTSITIPNSVTSIGGYAFSGCIGLTSITIPNSVTSIGGFAFFGCIGLTSITIPNSVTSIGVALFPGCTDLTSIVVEDDNPNYDSRNNCNAIIETKSNVLVAGCRTTTIPNSVTSIGESAFSGCTGLTSITIPNSVTSIGESAFSGCTGLTSITIPNSVTSIGSSAFESCIGLTSITIPNSVTSIGGYAFSGCIGLNKVNYTGDVKGWLSIDMGSNPIFYSRNLYLNDVLLIDLVIPDGVTGISNTFAYDTCLTSVTIPNSITSIGRYAFSGCTGLTSVTIPNSVTSIEDGAFSGCTGIDTLIIGNGISEISNQFDGCSTIKYLQLGSGMKSISDYGEYTASYGAFSGAQKLKRIVCYAVEPPVLQKSSFYNYNIHVQVPCDNLEDYETDVVWGSFKYIECIGADNADTDGKVIITPSDNEVEITWPSDGSADTYNLVITQGSKEICTLVFNNNGQLMRIAFAAPSRNRATRHAPAAVLTQSGYRFTVTGLSSGTQYAYTLDVKDKAGTSLNTYKGSFTTTFNGIATDMEDITTGTSLESDTPRKVFREGQVYILRGGKTYTIMGGYLSNPSKGEAQ